MKLFIIVFSIFITTVAYAEETDVSVINEKIFREEYCNFSNIAKKEGCANYRCNKDNSKVIGVTCAEARCSGKTVGFKGDISKPYPNCCLIPICNDFNEEFS